MNANTFGSVFCLTTFGESHGLALGGVIDGCPAGLLIDNQKIEYELARRKPGQNNIMSPRTESDKVEFLSGLFEGKTTGTPIAFIIKNENCHSSDYENIKNVFRPSHADFTYQEKYGIRDYKGGGRSSARTLLPCVVAGAIAKQILDIHGITIKSEVTQIGEVKKDSFTIAEINDILEKIRENNDTVGAVIHGVIENVPIGLGEPAFQKFQAVLAQAMFSINAVKGVEYGEGFRAAAMLGSECNDIFINKDGKIKPKTNHSGGIQGGITNGEIVEFNVAFKPIPSILQPQQTVDNQGNEVTLQIVGRHDVCVIPRVLPIVEAMAALVTVDFLLQRR